MADTPEPSHFDYAQCDMLFLSALPTHHDQNLLNGELKNRADLVLTGAQQQLLEAVYATGTPMVLVLICGKPLTIEIVQLYVNDVYSTVTTPVKELKAWQRVELQPGESRDVELRVAFEALSLVTAELKREVAPGDFEIMVGGSSRDDDLLKTTVTVPQK